MGIRQRQREAVIMRGVATSSEGSTAVRSDAAWPHGWWSPWWWISRERELHLLTAALRRRKPKAELLRGSETAYGLGDELRAAARTRRRPRRAAARHHPRIGAARCSRQEWRRAPLAINNGKERRSIWGSRGERAREARRRGGRLTRATFTRVSL